MDQLSILERDVGEFFTGNRKADENFDSRSFKFVGPVCEPPCQAPGFCSREMSKCFCGDRDLDYVTESCGNGEISLNVSRVPLSLDLMSSTQCFFSCVHIELVPMDRETMSCSWTGGNLP